LKNLHAAEGEELAGHGNGAVGRFLDLLDAAVEEVVHAGAVGEDVAIATDDSKEIVEVVGDATGQAAYSFHLVGLAQTLLELALLILRGLQCVTHAVERASDFSDFVAPGMFERIGEVAFFEGVDAGD